MFFINFGRFMKVWRQARILLLNGEMGTGKTLLGVALMQEMVKRGYVLYATSNLPVNPAFSHAPGSRNTIGVMDEAGIPFDNRMAFKSKALNDLSAEATFQLRKMGSYLVIPSFLGVDKRFRAGLRMRRTWAIRNMFWFYRWELGEETKEERRPGVNYWVGWLGVVMPSHMFGQYDTYFVPSGQLSISWLEKYMEFSPVGALDEF